MTRKKSPDSVPSKYEPQNRYHKSVGYELQKEYFARRQPKNMERWSRDQFRFWVEEYDYPKNKNALPYDVPSIAADLRLSTRHIYDYWRGNDGKGDITVPPVVVALCQALLKIKRLEKQISDQRKASP